MAVKRFRATRQRKGDPLLYALLAAVGARPRGRPPTITLGDLARAALSNKKRRPGRRLKARPMGAREHVEAVEVYKRERGLANDLDAVRAQVDEFAEMLGGRDRDWKERKVKQWQSQLSRARRLAGMPLRMKAPRRKQHSYSNLHEIWR